ncbi:hypothetical protein CHS0354_012440 [Potamilus streckersoni]|uniref:Uncharacterized protein n=1 Tax=Potamilus streckersoni TaxID=2493646 RepID=A0AAE0RVG5_9BIVA|nr:hypothetical protein CHS0354_012440 [Potamilus streckersoni]
MQEVARCPTEDLQGHPQGLAWRVSLMIDLLGAVKSMPMWMPLRRKVWRTQLKTCSAQIQEQQFRITQSATCTSMSPLQHILPGPDWTDQPSLDPPTKWIENRNGTLRHQFATIDIISRK